MTLQIKEAPLFSRHKKFDSPEYTAWKGAKRRTLNSSCKAFPHYGGRGIRICEEWKHSFATFYKDMGDRPDGTTLDRIDTNGDYTPDNCRWASRSIQNHNQRLRKTNKSGYRGVSWESRGGYWVANIWKDLVRIYLGSSHSAEQAALIYDTAAIQLYGFDAQTNFLGATS